MPKITLSNTEVIEILTYHIFNEYGDKLGVSTPEEITFNHWLIPYDDFKFEKKIVREVKLEDVEDMVIEQLKAKGEQEEI